MQISAYISEQTQVLFFLAWVLPAIAYSCATFITYNFMVNPEHKEVKNFIIEAHPMYFHNKNHVPSEKEGWLWGLVAVTPILNLVMTVKYLSELLTKK